MRLFMTVLSIMLLVCAGEVIGMGKSDGSNEEVKESLPEKAALPLRIEKVQEKEEALTPPGPKTLKPVTIKPSGDTVLVTVNGVEITQAQADVKMAPHIERMTTAGREVPQGTLQLIQKRTLDSMVEKHLINQAIKNSNIEVTDEQLKAKIDEFAKTQNMSTEEFNKMLQTRSGMSSDDFQEEMKLGLAFEKLIEKEFSNSIGKVSEDDARKYYEDNISRYTKQEQVKASHILVGVRDMNDEDKVIAKTKAEELLKKVKAGEDFAELAKENSTCPSKARGGDLGFFEKSRMVPPFAEAAFAMQPGGISDVVETQFGYHIIKVTDRQEAGVTSFEDEKENITNRLEGEKKRDFGKKFMEKIKSEAKITWSEQAQELSVPSRPAKPSPELKPMSKDKLVLPPKKPAE